MATFAMTAYFSYPQLLFLLLTLPLLGLLSWWANRHRARQLVDLVGLVKTAMLVRQRASWWERGVLTSGLVCLVVGMAGPRWGRDWTQAATPGRDLFVVLDLSRSMFAEAPSRLERALRGLEDLADTLQQRGGYRVGLVGFAGTPKLLCPLTHDLDHFRECVAALDPTYPDAELGSGTRIGAALTLALESFEGRSTAARDVLLLSDGDDPQRDGEWLRGVEQARRDGVPIHCVGIGDATEGHRIPTYPGWLRYQGQPVRTRLEEAPLRRISQDTGGRLLFVGQRSFALGEHYLAWAATQVEDSPDALLMRQPRQAIFLLAALVLLVLSMCLPFSEGRTVDHVAPDSSPRSDGDCNSLSPLGRGIQSEGLKHCVFPLLLLPVLLAANTEDTADLLYRGNAAYQRGDFSSAISYYEQAQRRTTDPELLAFNLATANYQLAQAGNTLALAAAESAYRSCLQPRCPYRAAALFGLGNCLLLRAESGQLDPLSLRVAIDRYLECQRDPGCSAELAEAAQRQQERARLLLAQTPPRSEATESSGGDNDSTDEPPARSGDPASRSTSNETVAEPSTSDSSTTAPTRDSDDKSGKSKAGRGTLPPVPDQADAPPLAAELAQLHLEQAQQQIQEDLLRHRRGRARSVPPATRDW